MIAVSVLGIDAAFAHMGIASGTLMIEQTGMRLAINYLRLVETEAGDDRKVVRKSSIELRRARELHDAIHQELHDPRFLKPVQFVFAEVPSGSQSASAARSLGIAVGVLASIPEGKLIEVSPTEVKLVVQQGGSRSKKMPSKQEMIAWAVRSWPNAGWLLQERSSDGRKADKGPNKGKIVGAYKKGEPLACNEHTADACAAIAAGIRSPAFQLAMSMMGARPFPQQASQRRRADV